ncbi:Ras GTPase-activating-like protein rng2 [Hypsizygus marmoreus]|uniref:Ras GTPase-activating-like protein rng2 n=1 Tax=Hypsizygus marmoreus TaxID=39966 RepID=A0A369JK51_HYPMA|nr:Ras GTPase-activating-like protein rng2 [Hypsizygus marmoreus]
MERSDSISSNGSVSSRSGAALGPFAYQTRLLERTSSRGGGTSLSRTNSQSGMSILTNPTGSGTPPSTRRWTPSHRVTNSFDATLGRREERARDVSGDENAVSFSSPTRESFRSGTPTPGGHQRDFSPTSVTSSEHRSTTPPARPPVQTDAQRTPTYLKRHTMPAPIIASPLSPNTTGITVEDDFPSFSSGSSSLRRIHLPSSTSFPASPSSSSTRHTFSPELSQVPPRSRYSRSNTLDSPSWAGPSKQPHDVPIHSPSKDTPRSYRDNISTSTSTTRTRPTSLYGSSYEVPSSPEKSNRQPLHNSGFASSSVETLPSTLRSPTSPSPSPTTSVMSPPVYRSSYMSNKKYGDNLLSGRRLGKHLPRIASGDAEEPTDLEKRDEDAVSRQRQRERRLRNGTGEASPDKARKADLVAAGVPNADDVAGLPGRIQLKAPSAPSSPMSSSRPMGGLWADTQRHLIHAYEYLCHVGEAQQWIEGCLGEELGIGVVEMEEGLRNGVVLAKLVRAFQGENAVRKIYEAPKLDFRHSDNINYFFNFVRQVGLPEGFIFELTDLYEKKNLPKVIYCIHALSHLLARRGMAERIGNLLGRLQFSDDQLQRTQKGLKDAGVAMPNFGNVGRELAKEINEEPEVEIETEDERRDRLLLENQSSIISVQTFARGFLSRKARATLHGRMHLAERHIPKLQAHCRGLLVRRRMKQQRREAHDLTPWIISLQALARAVLVRRRWHMRIHRIRGSVPDVIKLQAHIRGILQRRRFARLKAALRTSSFSVTKLQAVARARVTRNVHNQLAKSFTRPAIQFSIVALQAYARGVISRRRAHKKLMLLKTHETTFTALQAQCKGVIMRRRLRTQMAKLEDVSHVVIRIQAAVRTYLARKRLLLLIRGLRKATPMVVGFQARARANLARQHHHSLHKALSETKTIVSVGGFQARARAKLARNRHQELHRTLEFAAPDVTAFQAASRGALLRLEYYAWRDHLHRSHLVASILQAMLRGALFRRSFRAKMEYYRANLSKVVKIQSLFRAKEMREQYRQLTLGKNVTVGTIKNFVHLLDDSEADFQEEIKVERLRKRVVEGIRENQALENDVNDLDVKIALVVQNVKSFEEVIKARRKHGAENAAAHAARISLLAAHGDPFSGPNTLDHTARRKLELYQQLFYLLQTRGEYLSRLFVYLSSDSASEKNRRFTERVVLALFGYGQDRREDYLLLKLFQLAIREEINSASSIEEIITGHPMYINIAVHYVRPKQMTYARDAFQAVIREVVNSEDLDLEADPSVIHKARIDLEEMRSGVPSSKAKDVTFRQALEDPETRPIYIRHLQVLQWWTEAFVTAIKQSTKKMPYGMRYLARETLIHIRERFPGAPEEAYAACIGRLVYYRYINPAVITPETFDIVSKTVDVAARKNLAQISKILTQVTGGSPFSDDNPAYIPINDYVHKAIAEMAVWMIEVADVPDAETQFHAHEFLDATVQPKPIYISPNEIYTMHGLLSQHIDHIAPSKDDTLRIILAELVGVPNLGNEELKNARDTAITLELTNRFAHVRDPHAEEKTLWVQAKRGVLAILRVQPAQDLIESLMRPVTDEDELVWEEILEAEMENEQVRQIPRRQPSAIAAESAYRLEDIRSLKFAAVKALAISNLLQLEKQGKITRDDGFQGILNAIAGDVRSKHRKRLQRQQEMESMHEALRHLAERKKYFEEQINSYHSYVEAAMNTMQRGKGKKRFVLPFTKQYFHLRDLQKSGETPQFGSFLYTAKYLYEKGILLSIDRYSPRQFDKIQLTMSSNTAGVFTLLLESTMLGTPTRIASEDIRMEDLLQAKYEKRPSLSLLNGKVNVNFELFLYQINKKFYV